MKTCYLLFFFSERFGYNFVWSGLMLLKGIDSVWIRVFCATLSFLHDF